MSAERTVCIPTQSMGTRENLEHNDLYQTLLQSLHSPTQELEADFFDDIRNDLQKKRKAKAQKK